RTEAWNSFEDLLGAGQLLGGGSDDHDVSELARSVLDRDDIAGANVLEIGLRDSGPATVLRALEPTRGLVDAYDRPALRLQPLGEGRRHRGRARYRHHRQTDRERSCHHGRLLG